jgi:DNA-binding transcriptional regulator YhcF (GntR family)
MHPDIPIDRASDVPVYRQLADRIVALVKTGELAPGTRLPGERELAAELGTARGTVQKALSELLRLGVVESVHGSGTYVSDRAAAFRDVTDGTVRIAGVDCNPEALSIFTRQFQDVPHVRFSQVALDDVRADTYDAMEIESADVVLTTTTHEAELRRLLPALSFRILPVAVSPSRRTLVEMARIPRGAAVGIVCRSDRFRRIIENNLGSLADEPADADFLAEDTLVRGGVRTASAAPRLAAFLARLSVVVVPPDTALDPQDPAFAPVISAFLAGGGRIVPFEYQIERGSLVHLEEAVDRILSRRQEPNGEEARPAG